MGIRTINIKNPFLYKYKNNNINKYLFDEVYLYISRFIKEIIDECSDYYESCLSNNDAGLENYFLEISFTYKKIPIIIEYHFCYNNENNKIINNINISIKYHFDEIKEYGIILDKFKQLKTKFLCE